MKKLSVVMGFGASLVLATQADAHHSFAMFDLTKTVTMEGTVKELQWTQPHSWLQVMIPDSKGGGTEWSLEIGIMAKPEEGWDRKALVPGDKVTVVVHPLRRGEPGGQLIGITMPNGKVFAQRAAAPAAGPVGGTDLLQKLQEERKQAGQAIN
jgi:hypothetical protein